MLRSDRRRPLAWILLILGVGLAAWFLLAPRDEQGPDDARESADATEEGKAPKLLLATARRRPGRVAAPAGGSPAPSGNSSAKPPSGIREDVRESGSPASVPRHVTLRVIDAAGQPIHRADIALLVSGPDGVRNVHFLTRRDGSARIRVPRGRIVSVWVDAPAPRGARRLLTLVDRRGIDLAQIGEVRAEETYMLSVRTVDRSGLPRPNWRVIYRPREEAEKATGWWGATSDAEGWCRLGPFAPRTRVELRPGPRGLTAEEITDPAHWQAVFVDGTDVELVVGEAHQLRLAFPHAKPGVGLRIVVLDADTGEPLFPPVVYSTGGEPWTAPALTPGRRLEVLVLDERNGRFARMHDAVPTYEPLSIDLQAGVPIAGTVVADGLEWGMEGTVRAVGRGFESTALVDAGGRFKFRGLPDEPFAVFAKVRGPADGAAELMGREKRWSGCNLRISVSKPLRVTGRCALEGAGAGHVFRSMSCVARSPDWPGDVRALSPAVGEFELPLPAGRWRVVARGRTTEGTYVSGELDLGSVQFDRDDVMVRVR